MLVVPDEDVIRTIKCKAILFDMDGTLVDSTACVESVWSRWAERHGIERSRILAVSHGRRSADTIREVAPHLDIEREAMLLDSEEGEGEGGIRAIDGAAAILRHLPSKRWAVVTSADRGLAERRLQSAGLPLPSVLVPGDEVVEGKPNPAGYLKAAKLLGVLPDQCLVFEDAPVGILAARAAGMRVVALATTFPAADLLAAEWIRDFLDVRVVSATDDISLHLLQRS